MNNTGGNFPLLVDPVDRATDLRTGLNTVKLFFFVTDNPGQNKLECLFQPLLISQIIDKADILFVDKHLAIKIFKKDQCYQTFYSCNLQLF
jgi:hypothetical protein